MHSATQHWLQDLPLVLLGVCPYVAALRRDLAGWLEKEFSGVFFSFLESTVIPRSGQRPRVFVQVLLMQVLHSFLGARWWTFPTMTFKRSVTLVVRCFSVPSQKLACVHSVSKLNKIFSCYCCKVLIQEIHLQRKYYLRIREEAFWGKLLKVTTRDSCITKIVSSPIYCRNGMQVTKRSSLALGLCDHIV